MPLVPEVFFLNEEKKNQLNQTKQVQTKVQDCEIACEDSQITYILLLFTHIDV